LNKYGFRKVSIKKDEHYFYHSIFKQGNYANLWTIKRKKKGKNHISTRDEENIFSYIKAQSKQEESDDEDDFLEAKAFKESISNRNN